MRGIAIAVGVFALAVSVPLVFASATRFPPADHHHVNHSWPVSRSLTPETRLVLLRRVRAHDRWVISTRTQHRGHVVALHRRQLHWTLERIAKAKRQLRTALPRAPRWFVPLALCVHSHEEGWTRHDVPDGNGGYYGGGLAFMVSTWNWAASLSDASHRYRHAVPHVSSAADIASQPPRIQILATYLIVRHEGNWHPWPNTAAMCGLPT